MAKQPTLELFEVIESQSFNTRTIHHIKHLKIIQFVPVYVLFQNRGVGLMVSI